MAKAPPRRPPRQGEARAQILAGAERLLAETRLTDLSVEHILAESRTSRGTFYHYFGSKYDVVAVLAADIMEEVMGRIEPFLGRDPKTPPREALATGLRAGWEVWQEHRAVLNAVMEHWVTVPEIRDVWLAVIARFTTAMAAEIDREREDGLAPSTIPSRTVAATLLWSSAQLAFLADRGYEDLDDPEQALQTMIALWEGTLYPTA